MAQVCEHVACGLSNRGPDLAENTAYKEARDCVSLYSFFLLLLIRLERAILEQTAWLEFH